MNAKHYISGIILLLLFAGCECNNPTQVPINKTLIKGTVTDSLTGQPLQYTTVYAGSFMDTTDAVGRYRLIGMEGGAYSLTYDRPDYHLNYDSATVVKDDSVEVNIKLYPCKWEVVPIPLPSPWSYYVSTIREIYFVNELEGWAIGDYQEWGWYSGYGVILHTIDGGYTWEMQYGCPDMDENYYDIDFIDNQIGWAGPGATIGKGLKLTTDGGLNWDTCTAFAWSLDFINADIGYHTGGSTVFKTTDGGVNWVAIGMLANWDYTSLKMVFMDENNGWVRSYKILQVTHDGGHTWAVTFDNLPYSDPGFYTFGAALDVLPPGHIWVEGKYSSNNGISWVNQPYDTSWYYFSSSFCDPSYGWRSGANHALTEHGFYHTIDGGKTWVKSSVDGVNYINSLQFVSRRQGWAAGWDGGNINILIYK